MGCAASFPFTPAAEQPSQGRGLAVMVKAGCENHHCCASSGKITGHAQGIIPTGLEKKKSLQSFFLVLKENVYLAVLMQEHKKHHGGAKQGAGEVFFSNNF